MNAQSRLSDYYASIKLNPVHHDIQDAERMRAHEKKRRNLLEHCLKLPFTLWKNARVLEFGPASGQNAVVLARHGAKLTLVEPVDYLIAELRANFDRCGVADKIESLQQGVIERHPVSGQYDAIFAEGFIQYVDDAPKVLARLSSALEEGGFIVISVVHPSGTFIEFIKKLYLESAADALGIVKNADTVELARRLYGEQFGGIRHSRVMESWVKDVLTNPLYRPPYFLGLPEILEVLPDDVQLYSSWPNSLNQDDLVWHKNIKDVRTLRRDCLDGYYARYPHFLHSIPHRQGELELFSPEEGRKLAQAVEDCLEAMGKWLEQKRRRPEELARPLGSLFAELSAHPQAAKSAEIVEAAKSLFEKIAQGGSESAYLKAWQGSILKDLWGSPGHYYVFQRTDLYRSES